MIRKSKIYLDTSVISFLFADDAPDKRDVTIEFFQNFIRPGKYHAYISDFVVAEIKNTPNLEQRQKMLNTISEFSFEIVQSINKEELDDLALKYIKAGIIPEKKLMDAYHIAISVTNQI